MSIQRLMAAFVLCFGVMPVKASFDFGLHLYDQEDYAGAYREFRRAASHGHKEARYNLGVMYLQGQHVEQDWLQAYAWLSLAYAEGDTQEVSPVHERIFDSFPEETQAEAQVVADAIQARYSEAAIVERLRPNPERLTGYTNFNRPIRHAAIEFPRRLARIGAEGWADVRFTIDEDGNTRDHYVIHATHEGFGRAAIDAVRGHLYEPIKYGSHPTAAYGASYRINFFMEGGGVADREVRRIITRERDRARGGDAGEKFSYAYLLSMISGWTQGELRGVDFDDPYDWFWRSASMGHGAAAYMLGSHMLNFGDIEHGQLWLWRAAEQNLTDAEYTLGMEYLTGVRLEQNVALGQFLLRRAARSLPAAQIQYAWMLATHPDESFRNAELAEELLDRIERRYHDKQSYYQARAALAADTGDFRSAVRWQERALEDAKSLGIHTDTQQVRLQNYQNERPWRESL
ncbi:energy transducer TonB [Marinimicrobium alkaliphilum]|uniref:energy transducer TonB n=1 Tax=Marinimicrobium alkaliphilum TaxID=2202654 RepID=UPI000DB9449F|nr:energy transducer TonB [Marinimicrobium alkaliphilum]